MLAGSPAVPFLVTSGCGVVVFFSWEIVLLMMLMTSVILMGRDVEDVEWGGSRLVLGVRDIPFILFFLGGAGGGCSGR